MFVPKLVPSGKSTYGVLVVEQLHHRLDLDLADLQILGNSRKFQAVFGARTYIFRRRGGLHCIMPIDCSEFAVAPRTDRPDELLILSVGLVGLRKGAPYFAEVARRLAGAKVKFKLVGPVQVSKQAVEKMSPHVELVGRVSRSAIAGRRKLILNSTLTTS